MSTPRTGARRDAHSVSSTLTDPHGKVTASCRAAAGLRSALPAPLPKSASDRMHARGRFPQCSGTNATTPPMIVSPSFANRSAKPLSRAIAQELPSPTIASGSRATWVARTVGAGGHRRIPLGDAGASREEAEVFEFVQRGISLGAVGGSPRPVSAERQTWLVRDQLFVIAWRTSFSCSSRRGRRRSAGWGSVGRRSSLHRARSRGLRGERSRRCQARPRGRPTRGRRQR